MKLLRIRLPRKIRLSKSLEGKEMVSAEGIESALKRTFNNIENSGRRFKRS